jgi:hypothetical protein
MNKKLAQLTQQSRHSILPLLIVAVLSISSTALAGDILFVSDSETDAINIPAVLSGQDPATLDVSCGPYVNHERTCSAAGADFHNVRIMVNDYQVEGGIFGEAEGTNPALTANLFGYCSVFWSASGPHQPLGMFPNHATNGSFEDILQLYGPSSPIIFPGSTDLAGWTIGANVTWHIGTALSNDASEGVAYVDLSAGGGSFGQMSSRWKR